MKAGVPARFIAALLLNGCIACAAHAATTLQIIAPWHREAPPTARVHAAGMTLVKTAKVAVPGDAQRPGLSVTLRTHQAGADCIPLTVPVIRSSGSGQPITRMPAA